MGGGGVERHQEVITIGLTETGTGVTLSHVVPPFHSTGRERRTRGAYSSGRGRGRAG